MLSKFVTNTVKGQQIKMITAMQRGFATEVSAKTQRILDLDNKYVTPYYPPVPIVIERAQRIYMWDTDGNKYFDMLAGFAAVSVGHAHPKITEAIVKQANKVSLTSRSLLNTVLPETAEAICKFTNYDKFLACSSGVEACEAAVKVARRWGYVVKGVPDGHANILMMNGVFWGRSISASGANSDPTRSRLFGPFTPGFSLVDYNNVDAIENHLQTNPHCVAVMLEPIQGEGGMIVPDDGYLAKIRALCDKYNVLMVCDEVQSGMGRTGKKMCNQWDLEAANQKPDICTLGKAISGGVSPVSGIVADDKVMGVIGYGDHGSTYGGNPFSMAIAKATLDIYEEE